MLDIVVRVLSLLLGLGLVFAGLWGPNLKGTALIAGLALLAVALMTHTNLQRFVVLLFLSVGFVCLLLLGVSAIRETDDIYDLALQLLFLVVSVAVLGIVGFREGKNWLSRQI
jgi:peptidoglycan/LPS O-acetylase OafA/YrhL